MKKRVILSLLFCPLLVGCGDISDVEQDIIDYDALNELATVQYTVYNRVNIEQWSKYVDGNEEWKKLEVPSIGSLIGGYTENYISPKTIIFHQGETWSPFSFCDTPESESIFSVAWNKVCKKDNSNNINFYIVEPIESFDFKRFNGLNGVPADIRSFSENSLGLNFNPTKCKNVLIKENVTYYCAGTKLISSDIDIAFKNRLEVYSYIVNKFKIEFEDKINVETYEALLVNKMDQMIEKCEENGDLNPFLYYEY